MYNFYRQEKHSKIHLKSPSTFVILKINLPSSTPLNFKLSNFAWFLNTFLFFLLQNSDLYFWFYNTVFNQIKLNLQIEIYRNSENFLT